ELRLPPRNNRDASPLRRERPRHRRPDSRRCPHHDRMTPGEGRGHPSEVHGRAPRGQARHARDVGPPSTSATRNDGAHASDAGARKDMVARYAVARTVVVIPTYNERENIQRVVPQVLAATPCEVLVVDDESPDGTGDVVAEMGKADPRVH